MLGGKQPLTGIRVAKPRHCAGFSLSADPERVIARLKRDAATDPKAEALLDTLRGHSGCDSCSYRL